MSSRALFTALATLAVVISTGACGTDATGSQDCATLNTLRQRCQLEIGGLTTDDCAHALYFVSNACQGAIHTYLNCAGSKNCTELQDPATCMGEGQRMEVACANGGATIVTDQNGRIVTSDRGTLKMSSDIPPTPAERLRWLPHAR